MKNKNYSIRDLCYIGIFTAIIAVCAQVSIPMPYGVPLTLQTFAIPLAGVILGTKKGVIATLIYILLGAVGAPVFAGLTGGLGIIFGATGGFIFAFPIVAFMAGIGGSKNNRFLLSLCLTIGAAIMFACGMIVFSYITDTGLFASFVAVVLPFIPTEIIKIALVVVAGSAIKHAMMKNRLLEPVG